MMCLSITPKDGLMFEAWFDAKTHLLMRTVEKQGSETVTTTLSDYKPFDGAMLPVKGTIDEGSGAQYIQTVTLTKAEFAPSRGQCGLRAAEGRDQRFHA